MSQRDIKKRLEDLRSKLKLLSFIKDRSRDVEQKIRDLEVAIGLLEAISK